MKHGALIFARDYLWCALFALPALIIVWCR